MAEVPRPLIAIAAAIAVACTAATPPAEALPSPATSTVPPTGAPAAAQWSVLPVAELNRLVLGCIGGVEQTGDRAVLRSTGDSFVGGPTRLRPWIEARGDFGISATIGGDTENAADLSLYGALPQGEFWRGVKRLDVGLRSGKLVFIPTDCTWNARPGTSTVKEGNTAFWVRSLPPGWVDQAFRWAREADPQARFYYNENRAEGIGVKSDCVYAMVKGMKERGVPIDGVGMQSHFIIPEIKKETWNVPPPIDSVAANMKRYAELGLSVQVTEIDVKVGKDAGAAELAAQARVYGDMLRTCLAASNCSAFTSWGVSDRYSWIRSTLQGQPWEQPLPFDDAFRPKPAYDAMVEALRR